MISNPHFVVWQCTQADCRLRFPAGGDEMAAATCPNCGRPTAIVGTVPPREGPLSPAAQPRLHLDLFLDNIRSIYNVGAIFRTADGAGVRRLHLGGITATPEHPKLAKTALGAAESLPWHHYRNGVEAITTLRHQGLAVWALESTPKAQNLLGLPPAVLPPALLLVLGNELAGIDPGILALCDRVVALPMHGIKESLNVTIACGIAVYHLLHGPPFQPPPAL